MGLLCYILHLPDDWRVYKTWLYQALPEGKDAIKTAWTELEKKGFILEKRVPGTKGKLPESHYFVYERSQISEENPHKQDLSIADFPQSETRQRKSDPLLSTNKANTNKKNTKLSLSTIVDNEPQQTGQLFQEDGNKKPDIEIKKPKKEKKEERPAGAKIFPRFMQIYYDWYRNYTGSPPHITDVEGKNLKPIIAYFKKATADRAKEDGFILDEETNESKAVEAWKFVFSHWDKLESFLQDKTRITEINANLSNIIKQIKNGHSKSKQQQQAATGANVNLASGFEEINRRYGN